MPNWTRVFSIGGVAFFTTIIGLWGADAAFQFTVGWQQLLVGSILVALVQAGLAVCQEVKNETDSKNCTDGHNCAPKVNKLFLL